MCASLILIACLLMELRRASLRRLLLSPGAAAASLRLSFAHSFIHPRPSELQQRRRDKRQHGTLEQTPAHTSGPSRHRGESSPAPHCTEHSAALLSALTQDPPSSLASAMSAPPLSKDDIAEYFAEANMHRRPHHPLPAWAASSRIAAAPAAAVQPRVAQKQHKSAPQPQPQPQPQPEPLPQIAAQQPPPRSNLSPPPMLHPMLDDAASMSSASTTTESESDAAPSSSDSSSTSTSLNSPRPTDPFLFDFTCKLQSLTKVAGWVEVPVTVQIAALTDLADSNRDKAGVIVEAIKHHMRSLRGGDCRLPLMLLIDLICQELGPRGADYPKRFQSHIKRIIDGMLKHCSSHTKSQHSAQTRGGHVARDRRAHAAKRPELSHSFFCLPFVVSQIRPALYADTVEEGSHVQPHHFGGRRSCIGRPGLRRRATSRGFIEPSAAQTSACLWIRCVIAIARLRFTQRGELRALRQEAQTPR